MNEQKERHFGYEGSWRRPAESEGEEAPDS